MAGWVVIALTAVVSGEGAYAGAVGVVPDPDGAVGVGGDALPKRPPQELRVQPNRDHPGCCPDNEQFIGVGDRQCLIPSWDYQRTRPLRGIPDPDGTIVAAASKEDGAA